MLNRVQGTVYGQLIGDALGTRYEFKPAVQVSHMMKRDLEGHQSLPILGGGPFELIPGQVTDDSELALGLFFAILEGHGFYKEAVGTRYVEWYQSRPFDIGTSTQNAFRDAFCYEEIIANAQKYNKTSMSNGCLMRTSPLGLIGVNMTDSLLVQYCEQDTIMTNPHPVCVDAVKVYVMAIKYAILTGDKKYVYQKACETATTSLVKHFLHDAKSKNEPVALEGGGVTYADSKSMGYIGIAFQNAFYQLLHAKNFEEGLIDTVLLGGDTDTNGCICGALLGALYGQSCIPPIWINSIKIENPRMRHWIYVDQRNIDKHITDFVEKILS